MTKPKYQLLNKEDSEVVPIQPLSTDQLTYSWHNINVYSSTTNEVGQRNSEGWKRFFRKKKHTGEKHILKNVSGICRPGELLAILGASGAGKTTLLNVLNFRNNDRVRITGDVFVNGGKVDPDTLTSRSAYVQQDDMFIGTMTVREQLIFQAMLRMDRHLTYEQRMTRVEEVIVELGLSKCKDTKIGIPGRVKGISGGETKRLAFACEVLTNPPLLFCDEPTSGLDSFMAQNVVAVMKNMAEKNKTILSTIHQPSSEVYAMFDRVLLIAEGRVAFLGDVDECYEFFGRIGKQCPPNFNPADFFISTLAIQPRREEVSRETIHSICDQFADSEEGQNILRMALENQQNGQTTMSNYDSETDVNVKKSPYKATWMTQFRNLVWRSWLEVVREPMIIKVRFMQVILIALLLGVIYFNQTYNQDGVTNLNGALFLFLTNMTFQNVFGVINTFCMQIPIFLREHFNGMYRTDAYYLSKMIAELPFFIAYPIVFVSITYYMVGFTPNPINFLICAGIVILVANTSTSFGYLISCLSKNLNVALTIAAPFIVPLMLFGGFFLNKASIPPYLAWIQYLSWFNYGNEALNINQWRDVKNITCSGNGTCFPDGNSVLTFYHYDQGSVGVDALCLLALALFYRLLGFLGLLFKTLRKNR